MKFSRLLIFSIAIALLIGVLSTVSVTAAAQQGPVTLTLQRVGTSSFASAPPATDVSGVPDEIDTALNSGDADGGTDNGVGTQINRSLLDCGALRSALLLTDPRSFSVI